jgi:hypothetical protein
MMLASYINQVPSETSTNLLYVKKEDLWNADYLFVI